MQKNELLQEIKLRRLVRKAIKLRQHKLQLEQKTNLGEERRLRALIRHLLKEGEVDTDTEPVPYKSTAMNLLDDVFGQILPVIKKGLRKLTSGPEERISYRDHVLAKFKDMFGILNSAQEAGQALAEQEIKIKVEDDDEDEAPDIMPDSEKEETPSKEDEEESEFEQFAQAGKDETGARVAFDTIATSNVEDNVRKLVKLLGDDEKRQEAEEYFLYNLNLFMNKYEKALASEIGQEPAFTDVVAPKPEGAVVAPEAEEGGEEEMGGEEELEMPEEEGGELPMPGLQMWESKRTRHSKEEGDYYSVSNKLKSEGKIDEKFEIQLSTLTLEEILALRLELAAKCVNYKLYGTNIWQKLPDIAKDAVLKYAYMAGKTKAEMASFLGVDKSRLRKLLKRYDIPNYFMRNSK